MKSKTFEIITFAILIESIITYINQFFVQEIFSWQMFLSIILGIIVAVAYKMGVPKIKMCDIIEEWNVKYVKKKKDK